MKNYEHIPPVTFLAQVENRLKQIKAVVKAKTQHPATAPAGSIRIVKGKSGPQFYLITKKGDTQGKYLQKNNSEIALKIIQKDYETKALPALKKECTLLQNLLHFYEKSASSAIESKLSAKRRQLVELFTLTDEQFANKWLDVEYRGKSFSPDAPELTASNGLRVRSKSEVMIAEALLKNNIPFRYEFPLLMQKSPEDSVELHPDFYCLNVRTRQEFAWEHFGMMDDSEYADRAVKKISLYERNGWFAGKNALFTFETINEPLSTKKVNALIEQFLV